MSNCCSPWISPVEKRGLGDVVHGINADAHIAPANSNSSLNFVFTTDFGTQLDKSVYMIFIRSFHASIRIPPT